MPAVCLYAHKLAYLVGESLNDDPISRIVSCFEVLVSRYNDKETSRCEKTSFVASSLVLGVTCKSRPSLFSLKKEP